MGVTRLHASDRLAERYSEGGSDVKMAVIVAAASVLGLLGVGWAIAGAAGGASPSADPGFYTEVEPMSDATLEEAAVVTELNSRMDEWASRADLAEMTDEDIVDAIGLISDAIVKIDNEPRWWLVYQELSARQARLCEHLSVGSDFTEKEFCA
jgi:hypothetical protein